MQIKIFGTEQCPQCKRVTSFLDRNATPYEYSMIGEDVSISEVTSLVGRTVRSVPVIVVDGSEETFLSLKSKIRPKPILDTTNLGLEL